MNRFLILRLLNAAIAADARKDFAMAGLLTETIEHLEKENGRKPPVHDLQR
jgi:hypothetical protein